MHGDDGPDRAVRDPRPARELLIDRRLLAGVALGSALLGLGWWLGRGPDGAGFDVGASGVRVTVLQPVNPPSWTPDPEALVPDLGPAGLTLGGDLDPAGQVTCAIEPPLTASGVEILDDALPDIPEVARIAEGLLVIPAPRAEGTGVLKVPGYLPLRFAWRAGRCTSEPLVLVAGGAAVVGVVRGDDGGPVPGVIVEGCGGSAVTDRDGSYYLEAVPGQACTVQASRRDGPVAVSGDPREVTPTENDDQIVDLVLPSERVAGVGLVVEEDLDGVWVRSVVTRAAARTGIRAGDRVVSVDGELASDVLEPGSAELTPGEPGTEAVLVVEGETGRRTVTLIREPL